MCERIGGLYVYWCDICHERIAIMQTPPVTEKHYHFRCLHPEYRYEMPRPAKKRGTK